MRQLVITADDFGIAAETNAAVEAAHRDGVLTSASVMTNMPAFADAVAVSRRNPGLGMGVHLALTSGRPVMPAHRVPALVDRRGMFCYGHVTLSRLLIGSNRATVLEQVHDELTAQVDKARRAGVDIDHLDSHQHVHMIPAIWPLVMHLAAEHGGVVVRTVAEPPDWRRGRRGVPNLAKALLLGAHARAHRLRPPVAVYFAGLMDSGCVNVRVLMRLLAHLPPGISEIASHPSFSVQPGASESRLCCSELDEGFLRSRSRRSELEALVNPKVRRALEEQHIEIGTFRSHRRAAGTPAAVAAC